MRPWCPLVVALEHFACCKVGKGFVEAGEAAAEAAEAGRLRLRKERLLRVERLWLRLDRLLRLRL